MSPAPKIVIVKEKLGGAVSIDRNHIETSYKIRQLSIRKLCPFAFTYNNYKYSYKCTTQLRSSCPDIHDVFIESLDNDGPNHTDVIETGVYYELEDTNDD